MRFSFASGQTARDFPQKALSEGKSHVLFSLSTKSPVLSGLEAKSHVLSAPKAGQAVKADRTPRILENVGA